MTDEVKNETKCFCQREEVKKFFVIALGTFVGVYAALSLFTATHRPPMGKPCPMGYGDRPPIAAPSQYGHHQHRHFDKQIKGDRQDFHKAIKGDQGPAPFDANRTHDKN